MAKSTISAKERNDSLNPRQLRSSGKLPATLYGKGSDSLSIELDGKEFIQAYKKDKNAIFTIKLGKESFDSIVKRVHSKTLKEEILNIEFQKVRSDAKIKMVIPVETEGDSPAVKQGGNLITNLTEIEVECFPADIPSVISIDISGIENMDEAITLADVKFPESVEPTGSPDTIVLRVSSPEAAEEETGEEAVEGAEGESAESEASPQEASAE